MDIKTLDIRAKEWFDKVNGNSYHSVQTTINFGMPDEKTVYSPFQYGYGDAYLGTVTHEMQTAGLLPEGTIYSLTRYCRENGIECRYSILTGCRKSDVKSWGSH